MADAKKLSSLDASFLYLETPEMPMHVVGVLLLDPAAGADFSVGRLRQVIAEHVGVGYSVLQAHHHRVWADHRPEEACYLGGAGGLDGDQDEFRVGGRRRADDRRLRRRAWNCTAGRQPRTGSGTAVDR